MVDLLMDAVPLEGADKGERVFPFPCDPLPADKTGTTRASSLQQIAPGRKRGRGSFPDLDVWETNRVSDHDFAPRAQSSLEDPRLVHHVVRSLVLFFPVRSP